MVSTCTVVASLHWPLAVGPPQKSQNLAFAGTFSGGHPAHAGELKPSGLLSERQRWQKTVMLTLLHAYVVLVHW